VKGFFRRTDHGASVPEPLAPTQASAATLARTAPP
jgi:hypothetical protein